jgi:16S rRNA processing protein RimM
MAPKRASGSSSRSSTELLRIGRVGRPHGTDGGFTVADPTDRLELLDPGRNIVVGGREMTIAVRRGTAQRPILVLDGTDDPNAAEALRGEDIEVSRAELGALSAGEFLVDDLLGCEVVDGERRVGRVRDVLLLPSADVLEVELNDGEEVLVPLVRDAVRGVDRTQRRVDVDMSFLE